MKNKITLLTLTLIYLFAVDLHSQINRSNYRKSSPYNAHYQRGDAGGYHMLEIRSGTLWAWGRNNSGQIGNNSTTDVLVPTQIGTDNSWVQVSGGGASSYAIKANGTLWAWGSNSNGQLGDGTIINRLTPIQIGTATDWVAVSGGNTHVLAIKSDGTLWAWGNNADGQLGIGNTTSQSTPVQVGTASDWYTVAAGHHHSMAIKTNGSLWGFGRNANNQIAQPTSSNYTSPAQVGTDFNWASVSCGEAFSIIVKANGTAWSCGNNGLGQLGNSATAGNTNVALAQMGTDNKWLSIQCGADYTLGIKADGTLWSWGNNNFGQLGNGSFQPPSPMQIGTSNNWVQVSAGYNSTMAITGSGSLQMTGNDFYGQMGNGPGGGSFGFVHLSFTNEWIALENGGFHTAAISSEGELYICGRGNGGQIGNGGTTDQPYPYQVPGTNWKGVACGVSHTLAIRTDGTLWAWGSNTSGQLGIGSTTSQLSPVQVGTVNTWVSVSAGNNFSLGIRADGTLWAWGENGLSQLGDGTTIDRTAPVQIGTATNWTCADAGDVHAIGLQSTGVAYAWGRNIDGRLGDGTTTDRNAPTVILTSQGWKQVSANYANSYALNTQGLIYGTGNNTFGTLGDNTTTQRTTFTATVGLTSALNVSSGDYHAYAIRNDGALFSWGRHNFGQLGDGATGQRNAPGQVTGQNNVVLTGCGSLFGSKCSTPRQTICTTGSNAYGQFGNGTTTSASVFTCGNSICIPANVATDPQNSTECSGVADNFSVTATGNGVLTYQWQVNTGSGFVNITNTPPYSGTTTANLTVSPVSITYNGYQYRCIIQNTCGADTSNAATLTVNSAPASPGSIIGDDTVCSGTVNAYAVTPVPGATNYNWTLPSGWTGSSNTNAINATAGTTSGNVTVRATNSCGLSPVVTYSVTALSIPLMPGAISGTSSVCQGSTQTYSVAPVAGAASYNWTLPAGWTGNSTTNSITVNVGINGGNITVSAANQCGSSAARTMATTVSSIPVSPAITSGNDTVCAGSNAAYTCSSVAGATTYSWTLPATWTGSSSTSAIAATAGTAGGIITVGASNNCGSSGTTSFSVTVLSAPAAPASISGLSTVCSGSTTTYTASLTPDAVIYNWTLPSGWSGNSTSNTINATAGSSGGNITVTASNICGTSLATSLGVSADDVPTAPSAITGLNMLCENDTATYSVTAVPNTTSYTWTIPGTWSGSSSSNSIFINAGNSGGTIFLTANNNCGSSPNAVLSVTVTPSPVLQSVSNDSICNGGSALLGAFASAGNINWYASPAPGSPLTTGNAYNTPALSATTTYYVQINDNGCLSAFDPVTAYVTVIDTGVSLNINILTADHAGADSYQWIDCNSNQPLPGETNQSFVMNLNGTYAVIITQNGCSDTSACITTTVGIENLQSTSAVNIYPNPVGDELNISADDVIFSVEIQDMSGRVVLSSGMNTTRINTSSLSAGGYIMQIQTKSGTVRTKLIKQ